MLYILPQNVRLPCFYLRAQKYKHIASSAWLQLNSYCLFGPWHQQANEGTQLAFYRRTRTREKTLISVVYWDSLLTEKLLCCISSQGKASAEVDPLFFLKLSGARAWMVAEREGFYDINRSSRKEVLRKKKLLTVWRDSSMVAALFFIHWRLMR